MLKSILKFTSPIPFIIASIALVACNAASEQAFLTDAPAIISGALASGQELAAAYSAAQSSIGSNGGKLNITTGLAAAQAAYGTASSANLGTTVSNVFAAANQLAADLKAANPSATTAQIAAAQSSAITSAQVALQVAAPAGSPQATTAMFQVHYKSGKLYVTNERPMAMPKTAWNAHGATYSLPETQLALDDQGMEFTR